MPRTRAHNARKGFVAREKARRQRTARSTCLYRKTLDACWRPILDFISLSDLARFSEASRDAAEFAKRARKNVANRTPWELHLIYSTGQNSVSLFGAILEMDPPNEADDHAQPQPRTHRHDFVGPWQRSISAGLCESRSTRGVGDELLRAVLCQPAADTHTGVVPESHSREARLAKLHTRDLVARVRCTPRTAAIVSIHPRTLPHRALHEFEQRDSAPDSISRDLEIPLFCTGRVQRRHQFNPRAMETSEGKIQLRSSTQIRAFAFQPTFAYQPGDELMFSHSKEDLQAEWVRSACVLYAQWHKKDYDTANVYCRAHMLFASGGATGATGPA